MVCLERLMSEREHAARVRDQVEGLVSLTEVVAIAADELSKLPTTKRNKRRARLILAETTDRIIQIAYGLDRRKTGGPS